MASTWAGLPDGPSPLRSGSRVVWPADRIGGWSNSRLTKLAARQAIWAAYALAMADRVLGTMGLSGRPHAPAEVDGSDEVALFVRQTFK